MKRWSKDEILAEAMKYNTRSAFVKGSRNAYMSAWGSGILEEVCSHMESCKKYWSDDDLFIESAKFNTRIGFKKANPSAYAIACQRGLLDRVCNHMNLQVIYWDKQSLSDEASKFKTRTEFQNHSHKAYMSAWSQGLLDEICGHMENVYTKWDKVSLQEEAFKYKTRCEFQTYGNKAYKSAWRFGILDEICAHMDKGSSGFDQNKPAHLYVVLLRSQTISYVGFGVSNNIKQRMRTNKRNAEKEGFCLSVAKVFYFKLGKEAITLEDELKQKLPIVDTRIDGFKTEAVLDSDATKLYEILGMTDD